MSIVSACKLTRQTRPAQQPTRSCGALGTKAVIPKKFRPGDVFFLPAFSHRRTIIPDTAGGSVEVGRVARKAKLVRPRSSKAGRTRQERGARSHCPLSFGYLGRRGRFGGPFLLCARLLNPAPHLALIVRELRTKFALQIAFLVLDISDCSPPPARESDRLGLGGSPWPSFRNAH